MEYSCAFLRAAAETTDPGPRSVLTLLGTVTGFGLQADDHVHPFLPDGFMSVENLQDDNVALLHEMLPTIDDAELRARIADVVWVRARKHDAAEAAVVAYLESATSLEDPQSWHEYTDRVMRAARLAASLGHDTLLATALGQIEGTLEKYDGEDPCLLSSTLMELLLDLRQGDPTRYAGIARKAANRAESEGAWDRARSYWNVAARWHRRASDKAREREALIAAAETHVKQADARSGGAAPSHLVAGHHLQSAIAALRKIGGAKARADELHRRLLETEERAIHEFKPITHRSDITELVEAAMNHVKGKPLTDALIAFATVASPPRLDRLRATAGDALQRFPLQNLFHAVFLSDKGKVTARGSSGGSLDPPRDEAGLRPRMLRDAALYRNLTAQALVEPAREVIVGEHGLRITDFYAIARDSPLVPPGREMIFARGLLAGMHGDYLNATHLLMPQLEHALRYILDERGILTSSLDEEGIQEEFDLNKLLRSSEHAVALADVFGEETVFDLRGLLVERLGSNLRNMVAHGLLDFGQFYSSPACYFWWLTFRLCVIGWFKATRETPSPTCPDPT